MAFTSSIFLFAFFPLAVIFYFLVPSKNKNTALFIISILFYAFWRIDHTFLLIFSILIDFYCGKKIFSSKKNKKFFLCLSLASNLGILFYFKYCYFLGQNINVLFDYFSISTLSISKSALPLGVSFFTFQTMSYSIDIYNSKILPAKKIRDFATYVVMFPQLIAGPIVRYSEVKDDLSRSRKPQYQLFLH